MNRIVFLGFILFSVVLCLPHHKKDTDEPEPIHQDHPKKHGHSQFKILDCDGKQK